MKSNQNDLNRNGQVVRIEESKLIQPECFLDVYRCHFSIGVMPAQLGVSLARCDLRYSSAARRVVEFYFRRDLVVSRARSDGGGVHTSVRAHTADDWAVRSHPGDDRLILSYRQQRIDIQARRDGARYFDGVDRTLGRHAVDDPVVSCRCDRHTGPRDLCQVRHELIR